jgi:hypothetical protein
MGEMSVERIFWKRFAGNATAYGGDDGMAIRSPVTPALVSRHLRGIEGFGVYPIVHDPAGPMVHWGCCDIDTGDWQEAYLLARALQGMGLRPVVERSRSKGWHIWIFLADDVWVPASTMRRALKMAYSIIDLPAKEANPKQEHLRPDQLGNYVRLPYKGIMSGAIHNGRQIVMSDWCKDHDGQMVPFPHFLEMEPFSSTTVLETWADKWYEPERKLVSVNTEVTADVEKILSGVDVKLRDFARNGPKYDRSAGMVALAHKLKEARVSAQDAFSVVAWADAAWGKQYQNRLDGQGLLLDIIERAYG